MALILFVSWGLADHAHHLSMPDADVRVLPQQLICEPASKGSCCRFSSLCFQDYDKLDCCSWGYYWTTYGPSYSLSSFNCLATLWLWDVLFRNGFLLHDWQCDAPSVAAADCSSTLARARVSPVASVSLSLASPLSCAWVSFVVFFSVCSVYRLKISNMRS